MRAAFDAAGVHEHVRALNVLPRGAVIQFLEPAVVGLRSRQRPGLFAECSVQRGTDGSSKMSVRSRSSLTAAK